MNEKRLTRSRSDRLFFGVAGGLAHYLDVDPALVRLVLVLITLSTGYGLLAYFLLALLMPEEEVTATANGFVAEEIVVKDAV